MVERSCIGTCHIATLARKLYGGGDKNNWDWEGGRGGGRRNKFENLCKIPYASISRFFSAHLLYNFSAFHRIPADNIAENFELTFFINHQCIFYMFALKSFKFSVFSVKIVPLFFPIPHFANSKFLELAFFILWKETILRMCYKQ